MNKKKNVLIHFLQLTVSIRTQEAEEEPGLFQSLGFVQDHQEVSVLLLPSQE